MNKYFYKEIILEDLEENKMALKLPRREFFQLGKADIFYDWDSEENSLDIYIEAAEEAVAKKELKDVISILSYLYAMDLIGINDLSLSKKEIPSFLPKADENSNNENLKNIYKFYGEFSRLGTKKKKVAKSSIEYYARSLRLLELKLYEEAFLNGYKSMEIIFNYIFANEYQDNFNYDIANVVRRVIKDNFDEEYQKKDNDLDINNAVIRELENLVTARRKAINSLNFLELNEFKGEFGPIVRCRNQIGAHARRADKEIDIELIYTMLRIAHKVLSRFITKDYSITENINGEKKY